jgi:hypothetical protein
MSDWLTYKNVTNSGEFSEIATWINDVCKPDEIGDIIVKSYQGGRSADYSVQVFCKRGTGKLGKVVFPKPFLYDQGTFDETEFINTVLAGEKVVILLNFAGERNSVNYLKRVV